MKTYTQRRWLYTALILAGIYAAFFVVLSQADTRSQLSMSMYSDRNENAIPDHAEDWDGDGISDMYDDDDRDGIPNTMDPDAQYFSNLSQCDDGIDNDGDGTIDDPEDCAASGGRSERNHNPHFVSTGGGDSFHGAAPSECGDGIDNDGDALPDRLDPDCNLSGGHTEHPVNLQCRDGLDNDDNGLIDTLDTKCIRSRFRSEM